MAFFEKPWVFGNLKQKLCKAAFFLQIATARIFSWTKSKFKEQKMDK